MLLGVRDRIELFRHLPEKGKFDMLKLVREFRESLALTEAEKKAFGWTEDGGTVAWTSSADADITVPPKIHVLIAGVLSGLDDSGALPATCMSLYEKFVLKE